MAVRAARQKRAAEQIDAKVRAAEEAAARAEDAARAAARDLAAARRILSQARKALEEAREAADRATGSDSTATAPSRVSGATVKGPVPLPAASNPAGSRRIHRVGPRRKLNTPSAAARLVRDGDIVEIDAATYVGDVAVWRASNLTIRGVGGRPHLQATGRSAQDKAIWVIKGRNTTVENIEFSGARVRDLNGAGIRQEGPGLTLRRVYMHDNEMGLLTGPNSESDILIEHSQFARNTVDYRRHRRLGHNIYIGRVRSFTLRYSYVHHASIGHNVKSRARINRIYYNRVMDESDGNSSYIVDLAEGGVAYLLGNQFHQSPHTDNSTMVSFGAEGSAPSDRFYVINNTFFSDLTSGIFVQNHSPGPARLTNNIFAGGKTVLRGSGTARNNLITGSALPSNSGILSRLKDNLSWLRDGEAPDGNLVAKHAGFVNPSKYDYRLAPGSPAIDAGINPGSAGDVALLPRFEYRHPLNRRPRARVGKLDIGAFEASAR